LTATRSLSDAGALAEVPAQARPRWGEAAVVALLAAGAAALCLSGNWGSEFWWNDASRHAMDGAFIHDFVRDLPRSLSVYSYLTEYYARYPCLGLVQYPPLFPLVEAAFFGVLGVNLWAARATVAAFGALGAVFAYLVGRRFLGRWGAAVFVLLFVTAPGVVYWSRDVMLEVPVMAMMLAGSHFFLGYVEDERRGFGVAAAGCFALAVLTKQTAGCLLPAWAVYGLHRRGARLLWRRETLLAVGLAVVLLAPFVALTLRYSSVNVRQAFGAPAAGIAGSRLSWASLTYYLKCLPGQAGAMGMAGIGVLVLGLACRAVSGRRVAPLRGVGYGLLWAGSCYALMTLVVLRKEPRFVLIWMPGVALAGAAGIAWLARSGALARGVAGAATLALAAQAAVAVAGGRHDPWALPTPWVRGTAAAVQRFADSPRGTVVLYAGNLNGSFIFLMRSLDPAGRVVVLRDSKLLYAVAARASLGMKEYVRGQEAILKTLRDCGVRYLAVEDPSPELDRAVPVLRELRELTRTGRFRLLAEPRILAGPPVAPRTLRLYEYLDAGPARGDALTIELLSCGQVLRVPWSRLGVPTASSAGPRGRE
jgi:4-amino-4-deoxy-L-arabinose transferase-like glycosyltransferase